MTLDSSFCSGDRVVAFLRVGGISPEIAEALAMLYQEPHEYAGYQWDVGGVQFPSGGDFSSLGIFHVSYDEASETALVRAEFNNVTGAKELAFGLSLLKNGDQYIYYEDVIIPVTPSEGLHTAVDMALPEEKHGGGMHAVAASVYAGYVEVEFTFTPFCEVAEPDELGEGEDIHYPDDRVENHARDAQHEYLLSLEDRACVALDDAALIDREGNSTLVVDLPANVHPYAYNGWESSRNSFPYDFIDGGKYAARFVTTQVIDLSQIAAITIGGVEYPLQ